MSNVEHVTAAKPKTGGAIWVAPAGTALPTDVATKLNAAFKPMGYVSEDGLTNSNSPESDTIKAWGGDVVNTVISERSDTFTYTLIESLNIDVLKHIYGDENVTGDLTTGIKVNVNSAELKEQCVVVDTVLKGKIAKRIVIPVAKLTELGDITYKDNENVGYEVTIQALPDKSENTHYEYIKEVTTTDEK
ncbi:phage tail protein [Facklamia hominis]|uniref:Phage tail protein n=1 Tax=Facklamia hominis TaxID=178214 RepID=A0AAJ1Q4S8_9LACT|nr:phage tail protein [Facklamia hominis]MDK7186857.1 phage tail protein [Facklamia hominis]